MRNRKAWFAAALCGLVLVGCTERDVAGATPRPPPFDPEVSALIDEYAVTAQKLSRQLDLELGDKRHDLLIERLLQISEQITPAFVDRRPECKAYLEAALRIRHLWYTLEPEVIERDYHDDQALPTEGISPACYHMKDLIVHPASAAALLMRDEPEYEQAKREIDEVLAHVGVVRQG